MDDSTCKYYASSARQIAESYNSARDGVARYFQIAFAQGMKVLDIGAGSGRDMAHMLGMGCNVYGIEPCEELRKIAVERYPSLGGRLEHGELPNLGQPFGGQFDGVLCSAVLMHVPREEIFDAAFAMRDVLKPNGRLLLSIPGDRPNISDAHRDEHGRLFTPLAVDQVQLLFERLGFQICGKWLTEDGLKREGHSWWTLLFHLTHGSALRPLDQIEGILNRDRKVATYKLALFRALSEIALKEFEQARWLPDNQVAIPLDTITEKWLYYYWPLLDSPSLFRKCRARLKTASTESPSGNLSLS